MEIIRNTTDFQLSSDTAVALGKFDGVHVGHRRLLEKILEQRGRGRKACVVTFDPAPAVLFGYSDEKELSTAEEKRRLFAEMGVDILIEFPMNRDTAAIPPRTFLREYLCDRINARFIAAGEDVSFGCKGMGDAALLREKSGELEYELCIIEKVCVDGEEVSSTRIRRCVENGEMELAARLLGDPYTVYGEVARGSRIGRSIGFPTVNLVPGEGKLLPPKGVYFSRVLWNGQAFAAVSNVGCKPTVTRENILGVESYLYHFDREIYGQQICVELLSFRRAERKFEGLDELRAQLEEDIQAGRDYHCQFCAKEM